VREGDRYTCIFVGPPYHVVESVTKDIEHVTGVLVIILVTSNNVNLTPLLGNLKTIAGEGQLLERPYCSSNSVYGDECFRYVLTVIYTQTQKHPRHTYNTQTHTTHMHTHMHTHTNFI